MSEAVPNTSQEFWRRPVVQSEATTSALTQTCARCGSEFMIAASFCHVCGAARPAEPAAVEPRWLEHWGFLKLLEFHNVKDLLGLSTASLIAFLAGLGCVLAAIVVGLIYSVQNLADFQAIQLWRMQWLLAAVAAFVAGILLKKSPASRK
jgi:hypothetical protein